MVALGKPLALSAANHAKLSIERTLESGETLSYENPLIASQMDASRFGVVAFLLRIFRVLREFRDVCLSMNPSFAAYRVPGAGAVGRPVDRNLQRRGVNLGEGVPVSLIPVTAYTTEMVDRELGDGVYLTASDPRFKKYVRITKADHYGNFAFNQIPAGESFVAGEASGNEAGSSDTYLHQWGCERVTVGKDQTVRIKVSHNPQHQNSQSPETSGRWNSGTLRSVSRNPYNRVNFRRWPICITSTRSTVS